MIYFGIVDKCLAWIVSLCRPLRHGSTSKDNTANHADASLHDTSGWAQSDFLCDGALIQRHILVTTFNMGEGALNPDQLEKWLPQEFDLYAGNSHKIHH